MRGASIVLAVVIVLMGTRAAAAVPPEVEEAGQALEVARHDGHDGFCRKPRKPLLPKQASLCPLAEDLADCEAFLTQCRDAERPTDLGWLARVAELLAPVLSVVIWLVVGVAVLAVALPIVLGLYRSRRHRNGTSSKAPEAAATAIVVHESESAPVGDAETTLREARARDAAGEHAAALALYLRASLHALDHRGALRLERSRTHGEYVRACTDEAARPALAAIAREVDKVTFGAQPATPDVVVRVAEQATAIVRSAGSALSSALFLVLVLTSQTGCEPMAPGPGSDPAGDELVVDVLRHASFDVGHLEVSLDSLSTSETADPDLVLLVDTVRVALDDEASAHLLGWVDKGGTLLLTGPTEGWPKPLQARSTTLAVSKASFESALEPPERISDVALANGASLAWNESTAIAWVGEEAHAAVKRHGAGIVVGVASRDLFTNVGVSHPTRAAALLALVGHAVNLSASARGQSEPKLRLARPEDGVSPPSNPLSALVRAGLGPLVWHALAGLLVLFGAVGIRQAAPRRERLPSRRAFAEHVVATGSFWHRARATGLAVATFGRFVERRLRLRTPSGEDPLVHAAAASGVPRDDIHALLERARSGDGRDPPPAEAADLIRRLAALVPAVPVRNPRRWRGPR